MPGLMQVNQGEIMCDVMIFMIKWLQAILDIPHSTQPDMRHRNILHITEPDLHINDLPIVSTLFMPIMFADETSLFYTGQNYMV